uniref:Lipoxygenase domain-containing protein n=1 Tax=Sparus aurata TaxID=8175 RepID=A0A671X1L3_SPAAU
MVDYEVTIFTGNRAYATTMNNVFVKLVGTDGESDRTWAKGPLSVLTGTEYRFTVSCTKSIGKLVLIELDKQRFLVFPEDAWFPAKVEVKSPEGDAYTFPIYRWITDSEVHPTTVVSNCWKLDSLFFPRWKVYAEGMPHCIEAEGPLSLPPEVHIYQYDYVPVSLPEHWKEDAFFGYQYLNGVNPMLIRRCTTLPSNFPVPDGMVFLRGQSSLKEEIEKGNIFLVDYKLLDGVKTNTINGKKQYLMAPLVLLHKTPQNELMPIAIQLKQTPADDNPIFFPTDSEYDWLMAKIFVRSADFNLHQLNVHLLRTHLLAEVFAVSLLRNVPMVHPLYKLLIPHTRYTLQINLLARNLLISKTGIFTEFAASGGEGMIEILKGSLSSMTYSSLCIPDDIAERGLEAVPNFYYRDDGLRLWKYIHRFVQGVLSFYYKTDAEVEGDSELQKWISDIFVHGFLSQDCTGIPQSFTSVAEMVKFVTMVIFTCSAQHAAVNSGQYDYGGWMPNAPTSLQLPPPTKKRTTSEATMLETFPDINTTANGMAALWLLSKQSTDFVPLGYYPEEHFTEETPCKLIKELDGELKVLKTRIEVRDETLKVPYTYLKPEKVENSVAI